MNLTVVIDVDETITAAPAFFAWLTGALRRDGHRVVILTVRRDREETESLLRDAGVVHDTLETPPATVRDALRWKIARALELAPNVIFDDCLDLVNALPKSIFAVVSRDPELGALDYVG